eukprot:5440303-Amphidinium_carterae.1
MAAGAHLCALDHHQTIWGVPGTRGGCHACPQRDGEEGRCVSACVAGGIGDDDSIWRPNCVCGCEPGCVCAEALTFDH